MPNFINPYNFIPMGKKKGIAEKAKKNEKTYTGVIEYSVLTKSPLFIPNTSNEKTFVQSYEFDEEQKKKRENEREAGDGKKKEDQIHKSYDFYSYNDLSGYNDKSRAKALEECHFRPVIPGSEIRGMFRSNFEILTNSCMSALDTDEQLSKRTMERFKAGLLKKNDNGTIDLHSAKDALWRTEGKNSTKDVAKWKRGDKRFYKRQCYIQGQFPEGCRVSFIEIEREARGNPIKSLAQEVRHYDNATAKGKASGYILKGEKGPDMDADNNKHCCHIFYSPKKNPVYTDIPIRGNKLDKVLGEYEKNGDNTYEKYPYKEYREQWENFKKGNGNEYFPVYYSLIVDNGEKLLFLSPACITREIYEHTLADLAGNLKPCDKLEQLCPACRLFGTVMKDGAWASRIRFSDLEGAENYKKYYEKPVTMLPLSSPKLNNMEFYLKRPTNDACFWTYDYYIGPDGEPKLYRGELAELAGRKFYWHNAKSLGELKKDWAFSEEADQLNVTVRPLKADQLNVTVRPLEEGYTFNGKLYFKKLTRTELDLLIYLINAGDNSNNIEGKKHGYKLGAAKPLGFGSIACHVDNMTLISYAFEGDAVLKQEDKEKNPAIEKCPVSEEVLNDFEKMTNFTAASKEGKICYPRNEKQDSSEGFAWFVNNHGNKTNPRPGAMPSNRKNMVFREYMEAMTPQLKMTGAGESQPKKAFGNAKR